MYLPKEEINLTNSEDAKLFRDWLEENYSWKIKNKRDAEDLASTAFSKALECQKRNGIIFGHLIKIYKNTLVDFWKEEHKRKQLFREGEIYEMTLARKEGKLERKKEVNKNLEIYLTQLEKIEEKGIGLEDTILVFDLIRIGKLKHFPYNFFEEDRREKVRKILYHIKNNIWKCSEIDMWNKKKIEYQKIKLAWVINKHYSSINGFLSEAFEEKEFVPYRLNWKNKETDKIAIKLVQKLVNDLILKGEIKKEGEITKKHFIVYNLYGLYQTKFKNNKKYLLSICFPNTKCPDIRGIQERWKGDSEELRSRLRKFLEKEKINVEEIPKKIKKSVFRHTPYWGIFHKYKTIYDLVNFIFPERWTRKEFEKEHLKCYISRKR